MLMTAGKDGTVLAEHIWAPVLFTEDDTLWFGDYQDHHDTESEMSLHTWQFNPARGVWTDRGRRSFKWGHTFTVAPDRARRAALDGRVLPSAPDALVMGVVESVASTV